MTYPAAHGHCFVAVSGKTNNTEMSVLDYLKHTRMNRDIAASLQMHKIHERNMTNHHYHHDHHGNHDHHEYHDHQEYHDHHDHLKNYFASYGLMQGIFHQPKT